MMMMCEQSPEAGNGLGIVCFFGLQNIVIYDYNVKDNTG